MFFVFVVNIMVVSLSVIVHYEALYQMSVYIPKLKIKQRLKMVVGVFGCLAAHCLEVWIFGFAYYFMHHAQGWGELTGNLRGDIWDCGYFSFTVYTTLGFGDIQPIGPLRYLTGIEALTGLVLIAWSASFLYFGARRYWDTTEDD